MHSPFARRCVSGARTDAACGNARRARGEGATDERRRRGSEREWRRGWTGRGSEHGMKRHGVQRPSERQRWKLRALPRTPWKLIREPGRASCSFSLLRARRPCAISYTRVFDNSRARVCYQNFNKVSLTSRSYLPSSFTPEAVRSREARR